MEFHLFHIFTLFSVTTLLAMVVVGSHGTSMTSQEAYWKSVLPNTPIPKAITELLHPAAGPADGKSVLANDIQGERLAVVPNTMIAYGSKAGYSSAVVVPNIRISYSGKAGYSSAVVVPNTRIAYSGKAGYSSAVVVPNTRIAYGSKAGYLSAATGNTLDDELKVAPYFLEKDMRQGSSINVHFTKSRSSATFLPRQEADAIPFSSSKFLETLKRFSVKPGSIEAQIMKSTISVCEDVAMKGEEKYCATSLESMIDFTTSKLGKRVEAIATETETEATKEMTFQKYTINEVTKMAGDKSVVCHKNMYPYAVYYCHKILRTTPYMVSLVGADGTKVKAAVVCHSDTTAWSANHIAFKVLNVKPGSVAICHYLLMDTIVWVPKS